MMANPTTPPRQSWSTAEVESRHALAYWVDTICTSFLEIDIDSPNPNQFRGRLEQSHLGPATLNIIEADSQMIRRTSARIARSRYAAYFLLQLRSGQMRLQQFGRDCCIEPGDCVLIDCNAQYRIECLQPTRSLALRFPREWLRNWISSPESLAGRPLRGGESGWSGTLAGALANLDTDADMEFALPEGVVAEQMAALLAMAAGPEAHTSSSTDKLLSRIRRTIRDRCHEPDLTPTAIADEHRISKRYLHHLFAQMHSTFGDELMKQRLDCAQRMLSDARFGALKVSDIAARCGFLDPSHFARRFRKAYGARPVEFRAGRLVNRTSTRSS
jgi:AraC family transcriptional regulator, positive regulator of tynA and feaB